MTFLQNYSSILESIINSDKLSVSLSKSDIVIDPVESNLVGKQIVLTVPTKLDLTKLKKFNKIKSRFPVNNIELDPYIDPIEKPEINNYSNIILNEYMIKKGIDDYHIKDKEFLLGLNESIDGYMTSIGYKINKNNLDQFK